MLLKMSIQAWFSGIHDLCPVICAENDYTYKCRYLVFMVVKVHMTLSVQSDVQITKVKKIHVKKGGCCLK